jgi:hypothetical protein
MAGDMDGDGDIDFIGTNQEGYTIALNMGSQWNVSNILTTNDLAIENALNNASVFDHDGDGVNSLIVPYPGRKRWKCANHRRQFDGLSFEFNRNWKCLVGDSTVVDP